MIDEAMIVCPNDLVNKLKRVPKVIDANIYKNVLFLSNGNIFASKVNTFIMWDHQFKEIKLLHFDNLREAIGQVEIDSLKFHSPTKDQNDNIYIHEEQNGFILKLSPQLEVLKVFDGTFEVERMTHYDHHLYIICETYRVK